MMKRHSPIDLRDGPGNESLEPYQPPRILVRQGRIDSNKEEDQYSDKGPIDSKRRWLPRFGSPKKVQQDIRKRLTKRLGRLSSLDSTQTNSSMELETALVDNPHAQPTRQPPPMISITSNDSSSRQQHQHNHHHQQQQQQQTTASTAAELRAKLRQDLYRNYYGRPRYGITSKERNEDDEDENEDFFDDSPLPMPYSSSSMARSNIIRQQTDNGTISYPATFEELLDDRQGMNNSEQQFTKGEKANRSSIDGSIISDSRGADGRKLTDKASRKDKQRRGKSPSSSSLTRRRHGGSRRSFLSRFKLTKKHESIAKLQLSVLNSGFVSLKTLDRDLQSFLPRDRLTIRGFQDRVRLMRKFEVLANIEYRFASKYETYVCKHAQQESNQPKNNYRKCIPYDYNRVVLKTLSTVPDSDYINASHVDSLLKPNAYIAAQGPNENTIEDFWRMIWEQKTFVIVMLTKVFDFIRVMCNQYWPVEMNKPERYGNVEVTLLYEEPLADFVIRTIRLTKLKANQIKQQESSRVGEENADLGGAIDSKDEMAGDKKEIEETGSDLDGVAFSNDSSDSCEELIMHDTNELDGSLRDLTVRSPKFVAARWRHTAARSRRGRSLSPQPAPIDNLDRPAQTSEQMVGPSQADDDQRRASGATDQRGSISDALSTTDPRASAWKRSSQQNDFLHPLFNATHIAMSMNSLSSEPNTPVTPHTPSSAGIDRSSATRKAVKKKRRERIKNQRPKRTQFMVPHESQLLDDDDEMKEEPGSADPAAVGGKSNERIIYQFHYNSWASHTCPFISSLLHFRRRVRICMDEMAKSGKTGPTVVHCNDGCGRTGAYLCIDANLELAEEDNLLDVYNYTRKMRQSRKFLIENLEQYKFVYDTIDEALFCGRTWFPVSDLHKRLKHKSQRNPRTKKNEYLVEYEKICQMTSKFSIGDCAGGHRVENREKNRDVSTVPPDNFRPYLTSFQTNDSTDYINAVFVDGYTRSKEYIVTEWPLHRTISDFWSLVYDHDCNSVILLANPSESSTYPSFLPSEKELRRKFGPVFSAEMVSYTHYQNIKSWIYTINKKIVSLTEVIAGVKSEAKTTQVFQITCWPQGHRVPTSTNALVELMNMVERWRQRTTYGPVCVVSLNGKSRAGVYCAANVAIEQVVQHSEVDVFNAVKTVRRHRPQLIENMTEYKYCYDLILHYVLHYVNNQSPNNN